MGQCGGPGGNPCKSRPALNAAWLAKTLPAKSPNALSNCWCWLLTANLLTWTGIGTTNLFLLDWAPLCWCGPAPKPAFTLFHLARLFWNQIFTWTSLNRKADAIWLRSVSDRYFLAWNSLSNSSNCSLVKAVRRRRAFVETEFSLCPSEDWDSSMSSSKSEPATKKQR